MDSRIKIRKISEVLGFKAGSVRRKMDKEHELFYKLPAGILWFSVFVFDVSCATVSTLDWVSITSLTNFVYRINKKLELRKKSITYKM